MVVHLSRPAVGIESLDHFEQVIAQRRKDGDPPSTTIYTRNMPRRGEELCNGGSVYWIIKGHFVARQRILALERVEEGTEKPFCLIHLEARLIRTVPQPRRAHQGWRYLKPEEAPADLDGATDEDMPAEMAAELKTLGLI